MLLYIYRIYMLNPSACLWSRIQPNENHYATHALCSFGSLPKTNAVGQVRVTPGLWMCEWTVVAFGERCPQTIEVNLNWISVVGFLSTFSAFTHFQLFFIMFILHLKNPTGSVCWGDQGHSTFVPDNLLTNRPPGVSKKISWRPWCLGRWEKNTGSPHPRILVWWFFRQCL